MNSKIYLINGKRTPFGSFGGSLKTLSATDLAVDASTAIFEKLEQGADQVTEVFVGNTVQSSADAPYLARHVGLRSGTPQSTPALTINRLCGSGFEAWIQATRVCRESSGLCLAGGTEQMSQIPYIARGARWGDMRMGHFPLEDYMTSALFDSYAESPMAMTAEKLGEQYSVSREACDEYAFQSQTRYQEGLNTGAFNQEMTSITLQSRKGDKIFAHDEHPRKEATLEGINALKPIFKKNGLVTAGNASGIVDGAAMSLIGNETTLSQLGVKPICEIVDFSYVGCDPTIMGIGPAFAIKKLLEKNSLKKDDIDLFEVNEAFAAQYIAVEKELELDRSRVNVNGGAIAVGHPLAASGTRIMNHLAYELQRKDLKFAIGSACIGGGQGIAILIKNPNKK